MRIWKYKVSEYDKTSVSSMAFEGGTILAEDFDEAVEKIKAYTKEAWGNKIKLMITELTFEATVQIE